MKYIKQWLKRLLFVICFLIYSPIVFIEDLLEIKNALCQRLQDRRTEMQSEAKRLKTELQEAKELLKFAAKASRNRGSNDFKIYEDFLNK